MTHCLIELGTEELPPTALRTLSDAFTYGVVSRLAEAGLNPGETSAFATPRRLAILLADLPLKQNDQSVEKRGPAVAAAFDADGKPTRAAEGFARSCGVGVADLEQRKTDKGAWLYFQQIQPGQTLQALLPTMVKDSLAALPIPKRMRWGDSDAEFVRPVHWLVMMLDEQVIDCEILGLRASNQTRGHRFHAPQPVTIGQAADYRDIMLGAKVEASFEQRRETIRSEIESMAGQLGGRVHIDQDLLDEVTSLVEWPVAISGRFDQEFLQVPAEALVTTMQDNQKYFAIFGDDGQLLPHFITISNIESRDPSVVSRGNERVIRPRFADAKFFWEQDRRSSLSSRLQSLENVVFQHKLGSIGDKVMRVRMLAGYLAGVIGADVSQAERAAELCKCDLMTEMVGEFPKLQGIMGRYYARHDGETEAVADAIEQHYRPRYAGDALPDGPAGQIVALADRIDTLVGIFAIGQKPTGVKDPFGLRRAALGVIRILVEKGLDVDIVACCHKAADGLADKLDARDAVDQVVVYIHDRLKAYYHDQKLRYDVVDAVLETRPPVLTDLHRRVVAVDQFLQQDAALALAAANKRISNILRKQEEEVGTAVDSALLHEAAEQALHAQLGQASADADVHLEARDYQAYLNQLAGLRPAVDRFFDEVMVMDEDMVLRNNRLALLHTLAQRFLKVADFSRIQS
jgi:glycyl-tRNA synthetase beta chain